MLKRMSISSRLMLFLPVLLAALCAIVFFGLAELRQSLIADRKEALKDLVHVALSVVKTWHERETAGQITREQAQDGARNDLWRLRFADNNYFFVQRYDGVTMVQLNREIEGKNRIDTTDVDGVQTVRRQIEAASIPGSGRPAPASTSTMSTPSTTTSS